ncbi:hypothetical protein DAETH_44300 (plasmid) [Deinococcus aetherius]|uniref:Uncharacterized protein n=1 Tax=Deinococcus aetherius TaxID=200252 RepID=A0ABN6RMB2_9DEIO|nr:hypothetical protein DAETH_44300 [Deinococcus aetherius]
MESEEELLPEAVPDEDAPQEEEEEPNDEPKEEEDEEPLEVELFEVEGDVPPKPPPDTARAPPRSHSTTRRPAKSEREDRLEEGLVMGSPHWPARTCPAGPPRGRTPDLARAPC